MQLCAGMTRTCDPIGNSSAGNPPRRVASHPCSWLSGTDGRLYPWGNTYSYPPMRKGLNT